MRWIACCLMAVCFGLGVSALLLKHFASRPSDPNLTELGLTGNLDQLAAPGEPQPAAQSGANSSPTQANTEVINLFARPLNPANRPPAASTDQELLPSAYFDSAGAVELENHAYQWMPLCRELADGPTQTSSRQDAVQAQERMPRCDEPSLRQMPTFEERPR
jgi:hypothetical protein